jgi:sugar lactone lactonase YvrE/4-amino-4-deoxy-L-arabinose transferase-like glycosyltransferase
MSQGTLSIEVWFVILLAVVALLDWWIVRWLVRLYNDRRVKTGLSAVHSPLGDWLKHSWAAWRASRSAESTAFRRGSVPTSTKADSSVRANTNDQKTDTTTPTIPPIDFTSADQPSPLYLLAGAAFTLLSVLFSFLYWLAYRKSPTWPGLENARGTRPEPTPEYTGSSTPVARLYNKAVDRINWPLTGAVLSTVSALTLVYYSAREFLELRRHSSSPAANAGTVAIPPAKPLPPAKRAIAVTSSFQAVSKRVVREQVQPSPALLWLGIGAILVSLGLLTLTHTILSVGLWQDWDLQHLAFLRPLACIVPGFCDMRFPPYAFVAFLAALLAALLFGSWLSRLPLPSILGSFPSAPVAALAIRRLASGANVFALAALLSCEAYVATQIALDQPVSPVIWLMGLGALLWLIWNIDQAGERVQEHHVRFPLREIGYLGSIMSLLITIAAVSAHRFILAGSSLLVTLALLLVSLREWGRWSRLQRLERASLPAITAVSFLLLSYGLRAWNWSFVGDEYIFYAVGRQFAEGRGTWPVLSGAGIYGHQPVLSSVLQGASMWLLGTDSYGWRISNTFLLAISIPLLYYFARQFLGVLGGLVTAALYGCAHMLLSFGKIGYNNPQVILVLASALAAFTWASQQGSLAGFGLTGIVLGLGFYTYGVARLFWLVVFLWLLLYYFPNRKTNWAIWGVVIGSALITLFPVMSSRTAREGIFIHTFFNSDIAHTWFDVLLQFLNNSLYGLTSFLTNSNNTHFVFGPHADPLTGSLMILGLAALLVTWSHGWRERVGLLGTWGILTLSVAGIQNYAYPNNTWMFTLVPLYALFASIGLISLCQSVTLILSRAGASRYPGASTVTTIGAILVIALAIPLNAWMSIDLSQRKLWQPQEAFVLQTAQLTADSRGNGPRIYFVVPYNYHLDLMLTMYKAYGIPLERLVVACDIPLQRLGLLPPQAALSNMDPCQSANDPAVLIMVKWDTPEAALIRARMETCWPGAEAHIVRNTVGSPVLYRLVNSAARPFVHPVPGFWSEEAAPRPEPSLAGSHGIWQVSRPLGITTDAQGQVAVIEADSNLVVFFDVDGRPVKVLRGDWIEPSAVGFASNGDLIVLDAGSPNGVLRFDAAGQTQERQKPGESIIASRGLFVAEDGTLYVADTERGRILHLDEAGQVLQVIQGSGKFLHPTTVAVATDGRLAIADPVMGKVYVLDSSGRTQMKCDTSTGSVEEDKPGLVWMPDSSLLVSEPGKGRVVRLTMDCQLVREWQGLARPTGLALSAAGRLYVIETDKSQVTPLALP